MKRNFIMGMVIGAIITSVLSHYIFAETISKSIMVYPNYANLDVNGKEVETENFLYNGTTYIPLREVAELLGKKVDWNQKTRTAKIYDTEDPHSKGSNKSNTSEILDKYKVDGKGVFKGYFQNLDYSNSNLFLQSGDQTKITKEIQSIADNFNNKNDMSTIKEIYQWMSKNLRGVEAEKFSRTSHDILVSRGVTGCTDYGLAFTALARAKGIPTVFIQTARIDWIRERQEHENSSITGHILAEVYIDVNNDGNKEWCLVDPTSGRLYLDYDRNKFSLSEGYYVFAKSLEVWDSGALNERENWEIMMDLFKDFDLSLYKNPKYKYINLMNGKEYETGEFAKDSTVIGNSAQMMGCREPVELFDSMFTYGFQDKDLLSFSDANKNRLLSSQRIIALYSYDMENVIPDYVKQLIPEIENSKEEFIMNKVRDGRRIILIKAKDESRLIEVIKNLPDDFLDNNY